MKSHERYERIFLTKRVSRCASWTQRSRERDREYVHFAGRASKAIIKLFASLRARTIDGEDIGDIARDSPKQVVVVLAQRGFPLQSRQMRRPETPRHKSNPRNLIKPRTFFDYERASVRRLKWVCIYIYMYTYIYVRNTHRKFLASKAWRT